MKPRLLAQHLFLQMNQEPIWKNAGIWSLTATEPHSYAYWSNILLSTHQYPALVQERDEPGTSLSVLLQVVVSGCLLFSTPLNGSLPPIPHPASSPGPRAVSTADIVARVQPCDH